jgi:hypothetical protein
MYTMLMFPGGRHADALLLSVSEGFLRLAVSGRPDAFELRKSGDAWVSEAGDRVELGAWVALGAAAESRPRKLTAGAQ